MSTEADSQGIIALPDDSQESQIDHDSQETEPDSFVIRFVPENPDSSSSEDSQESQNDSQESQNDSQESKKRKLEHQDDNQEDSGLDLFTEEYSFGEIASQKESEKKLSMTELIDKQQKSISQWYQDNTEPVDKTRETIQWHIADSGMFTTFWKKDDYTKPRIRPGFRLFNFITKIRNKLFSVEQAVDEFQILFRMRKYPAKDEDEAVAFFKKCIEIAVQSDMYYTYLYKKQKEKNNEKVDYTMWYIDQTKKDDIKNNVLYPYFKYTQEQYENEFIKYRNSEKLKDVFLF